MKQYLLIEISEINSRIKELGHLMKIADDDQSLEEFSNKRDECFNLKTKGKIVKEIPHTHGKDYKLLKTII